MFIKNIQIAAVQRLSAAAVWLEFSFSVAGELTAASLYRMIAAPPTDKEPHRVFAVASISSEVTERPQIPAVGLSFFFFSARCPGIRPPGVLWVGPVLPSRRIQWTPPLYDFPNMLKSVSTKCVVTGCLYRGLDAISYRARDRALWKRANSLRS